MWDVSLVESKSTSKGPVGIGSSADGDNDRGASFRVKMVLFEINRALARLLESFSLFSVEVWMMPETSSERVICALATSSLAIPPLAELLPSPNRGPSAIET